jgi:putative ABC transport system permease protein
MRLALAARLMARESRGARGKIVFFVACLAVGVAAVVAVAGLSSGVDVGLRREARRLLAADLAVSSDKPIPEVVTKAVDAAVAARPGARATIIKKLGTIVALPAHGPVVGTSALVQLKAVGDGWPFYGDVTTEPSGSLKGLLGADGVLVAPELADKLHLTPGGAILVGGKSFVVRGRILSEPDSLGGGLDIGPRLLTSLAVLDASGLEAFGSRLDRKILVKLPDGANPADLERARKSIEASIPKNSGVRVETYTDAQPRLRDGFAHATRFIGLVALVSLILGGIGVAQSVRAWLTSRMDAIAVLKCLGVRPAEVIALYAAETALLGLAGSLVGVALGTAVLAVVPSLLGGVLPSVPIDAWQPWAAARGLALGTGVALLFSVAPLASLRLVPPLRVLRRDAEPLQAGLAARGAVAVVLVGGLFATAWIQSGSPRIGAAFTAGIIAAAAVLAGAARLVMRSVARVSRDRVRVVVRQGLAAVARPGAGTLSAVTALGLGVLVVVGIALVQAGLSEKLRADLPKDAPNVFLVDMQAAQWPRVQTILEAAGATHARVVPIVSARLVSVDGVSADVLAKRSKDGGRGKWIFTRDQNLTYMKELPGDNRVVEGRLWSDPQAAEVSLERDYAKDMGAHLGSRVVFDVQGVSFPMKVTSLRDVDWKSFGINFFVVVEPGVLDAAPQMRVAAAQLPTGGEQALQDRLAAAVPNVTLLKVREIVEKVAHLLDRIGLAIRILGGFAVAAGIAILAGAVGATAARRGREVALLKTLGATRAGVVGIFSVEFALVGAVAGLVGTAGGTILAWAVLTRGMDLPWSWHPVVIAVAPAGTILLSVLAGIAASAGALSNRPIEVLRAE